MKRSPFAAAVLFAASIAHAATVDNAVAATSEAASGEEVPEAALLAREGQMMPETASPIVGHKQVIGLFIGGYDSAPGAGPMFNATVEGELWHRIALEVGIAYEDGIPNSYPSVGVRVGLLRQALYKVDLALLGHYKNAGSSVASGEVELGVLVGHRWSRMGFQANAIYGQGIDPGERNVELRASLVSFVRPRLNVGVEVHSGVDLGAKTGLDFLAGVVAQLTVVEHVVLVAELGPHVVVDERPAIGAAVLAGLGATY